MRARFILKKHTIFAALLIACINYGFAIPNFIYSNYVSKTFGVKDGLPQIQITKLFVDKNGFLWIGTRNGVARWDGKKMYSILNEDSLKIYPQQVETIKELPDGSIFVLYSVRNGLLNFVLIKGNKPVFYNFKIPTKYKIIKPIQTKVTFIGQNLIRFNFQIDSLIQVCEFNRIDKKFLSKLVIENVVQLHLASKDFILYSKKANDSSSLVFYGQKNNKIVTCKKMDITRFQSFQSTKIQSLSLIGEQYVSYKNNKIYRFKIDKKLQFYIDSISPPFQMRENDRIRISHNGFMCRKGNALSYFCDENGFLLLDKMDIVWDFLKDKQGNLYIGTEHGLRCFFNQGIEEIKFNNEGVNDNISNISRIINGKYYYSTSRSGIFESSDNKTYNVLKIPGFNSKIALSQVVSNNQNDIIYPIIENKKIVFKTNGQFKYFDIDENGPIYSIKVNPITQDIVASIGYGVYKFDAKNKSFSKLKFRNYAWNGKIIYDMSFDNNGTLYLKNELNTFLLSLNGKEAILSKNEVPGFSVFCDSYNSVWINSGKSMSVFKQNKQFFLQHLPIKTPIMAISQVGKWLIIGSLQDLTLMDLEIWHKTAIEDYYTFSVDNQLNILEGNQNNFFVENDSVFYWPCLDKLLKFNVNKLINLGHIPPKIVIQEYIFYNENEKNSVFDTFLQKEYLIQSNFRNFEVKFSCPTYLNHNNIQYRYKVKPDDPWIYINSNELIRIIDIAKGTYQFEIQASFDGVLWNESVKSLPIVFQPRFYETFMFWAFLILSIAFIGYFVLIHFLKKLKITHDLELKERIEKNSLSLQVIKSKYIPHFTFNAMTSINYLLRKEEIKKASAYLIKMTDLQRIALSNFDNPETMLETELKFLSHYLSLEGLRFEDTLTYKISVGKNVDMSVMVPNLSIHTMVENAIKHGLYNKPDGNWKLSVYVIQLKNKLIISVEDNGLGLEKANENKTHSTGSGLKMLKKQLKILSNESKQYTYRLSDIYDSKGQIRGARSSIFITSY